MAARPARTPICGHTTDLLLLRRAPICPSPSATGWALSSAAHALYLRLRSCRTACSEQGRERVFECIPKRDWRPWKTPADASRPRPSRSRVFHSRVTASRLETFRVENPPLRSGFPHSTGATLGYIFKVPVSFGMDVPSENVPAPVAAGHPSLPAPPLRCAHRRSARPHSEIRPPFPGPRAGQRAAAGSIQPQGSLCCPGKAIRVGARLFIRAYPPDRSCPLIRPSSGSF